MIQQGVKGEVPRRVNRALSGAGRVRRKKTLKSLLDAPVDGGNRGDSYSLGKQADKRKEHSTDSAFLCTSSAEGFPGLHKRSSEADWTLS